MHFLRGVGVSMTIFGLAYASREHRDVTVTRTITTCPCNGRESILTEPMYTSSTSYAMRTTDSSFPGPWHESSTTLESGDSHSVSITTISHTGGTSSLPLHSTTAFGFFNTTSTVTVATSSSTSIYASTSKSFDTTTLFTTFSANATTTTNLLNATTSTITSATPANTTTSTSLFNNTTSTTTFQLSTNTTTSLFTTVAPINTTTITTPTTSTTTTTTTVPAPTFSTFLINVVAPDMTNTYIGVEGNTLVLVTGQANAYPFMISFGTFLVPACEDGFVANPSIAAVSQFVIAVFSDNTFVWTIDDNARLNTVEAEGLYRNEDGDFVVARLDFELPDGLSEVELYVVDAPDVCLIN